MIYKICRVDDDTPIYIGKSNNLYRRWNEHKYNCVTPSRLPHYNLLLYHYIRENGGFENFRILEMPEEFSEREAVLRYEEIIMNKQTPKGI